MVAAAGRRLVAHFFRTSARETLRLAPFFGALGKGLYPGRVIESSEPWQGWPRTA
jgi:hypothetical protein